MILDTHNQWHFLKLVLEDPPKKKTPRRGLTITRAINDLGGIILQVFFPGGFLKWWYPKIIQVMDDQGIPSLRLVLCPQPAFITQNPHGIRAEDRWDGGTGYSHGEALGFWLQV